MKTDHEDLCLVPLGAEVCVCDEIRQRRDAPSPWADIMVTTEMEREEAAHDHSHTREALRVEAESLGHSRDCAAWIWPGRMPCDCGKDEGTIKGELIREDGEPT